MAFATLAHTMPSCKQPLMPVTSPRPLIPLFDDGESQTSDRRARADDSAHDSLSSANSGGRPPQMCSISGHENRSSTVPAPQMRCVSRPESSSPKQAGSQMRSVSRPENGSSEPTTGARNTPSTGFARVANVDGAEPVQGPSNRAPPQSSRKIENTPRVQKGFTLQDLRKELQTTFRELNATSPGVAGELRHEIKAACQASTESLREDIKKYMEELKTELKRDREDSDGKSKACSDQPSERPRVSATFLEEKAAAAPSRKAAGNRAGNVGFHSDEAVGKNRPRSIAFHSGEEELHAYEKTEVEWSPLATEERLATSRKSTIRRSVHVSIFREEEKELRPKSRPHNLLRPAFTQLVCSEKFHHSASVAVMLYTVFIGIESDYSARYVNRPVPVIFKVMEVIFGIIFLIEITLRILVHGVRFFTGSSWKSNVFDLAVVVLQGFEMLASLWYEGWFLRNLKLLRCLRLIHVLHMVGELRTLTISIMNSVRSLFWSVLLLVLISFIFGVTLTNIVSSGRRNTVIEAAGDYAGEAGLLEEAAPEQLTEFYGSLTATMLMLYQCITDGRHWGELVTPLVEACSPWLALLFCVYMSFMIFAMLNVLTAFFVESTLRVAEEDKKRHMMSELWEAFRPPTQHDEDEDVYDHSISIDEFQRHLDNPKMKAFLDALDLDAESAAVSPFFHLIDTDGSGEVDAEELVSGCLRLTGVAKSFDVLSFAHDYREDAKNAKDFWVRTELGLSRMEDMLSDILQRTEASHF
eukprot:TRINITY_DN6719_c0_g1_i3.p1 TRINITY_DN6719_c0_g1~~TRINITY_DN6719_c0_g1_i3.p1  ORF type:complete len:754 (-),score=124.10 TRINITY_DN6719_c0_g1_i3:78-2339(-)